MKCSFQLGSGICSILFEVFYAINVSGAWRMAYVHCSLNLTDFNFSFLQQQHHHKDGGIFNFVNIMQTSITHTKKQSMTKRILPRTSNISSTHFHCLPYLPRFEAKRCKRQKVSVCERCKQRKRAKSQFIVQLSTQFSIVIQFLFRLTFR